MQCSQLWPAQKEHKSKSKSREEHAADYIIRYCVSSAAGTGSYIRRDWMRMLHHGTHGAQPTISHEAKTVCPSAPSRACRRWNMPMIHNRTGLCSTPAGHAALLSPTAVMCRTAHATHACPALALALTGPDSYCTGISTARPGGRVHTAHEQTYATCPYPACRYCLTTCKRLACRGWHDTVRSTPASKAYVKSSSLRRL